MLLTRTSKSQKSSNNKGFVPIHTSCPLQVAGGSFPCHPNSGDQADSTFSLGNISGHMEEDRDMAVSHSSCLLSPEENMLLSFIFHRPKQVTRQCLISRGQGGMILGCVQQEESWFSLCSSDDDHKGSGQRCRGEKTTSLFSNTTEHHARRKARIQLQSFMFTLSLGYVFHLVYS